MRIYVAGKYSADNIIDILNNMRTGIKVASHILKAGHEPFCPFLDYQFQFFEDLTIDDYYRYSMSFLEHWADELWILPGWENSQGTKKEIDRARELNVPVRFL